MKLRILFLIALADRFSDPIKMRLFINSTKGMHNIAIVSSGSGLTQGKNTIKVFKDTSPYCNSLISDPNLSSALFS